MMSKTEFMEYVKEHIKEYLGSEYQEASVQVDQHTKNNDVRCSGLCVRTADRSLTPILWLDQYYEWYQNEEQSIETVMEKIAEVYRDAASVQMIDFKAVMKNYETVKKHLFRRLCDYESNAERLRDLIYTVHGDFAAIYYIDIGEKDGSRFSAPITNELLKIWNITKEQLMEDTVTSEKQGEIVLCHLEDVLFHRHINLFKEEGRKDDTSRLHHEGVVSMYVLTNSREKEGASLILDREIRQKIARILDDDYYVLPSSIYEVMLVPAGAGNMAEGLVKVVAEINEEVVDPEEVLSTKVQYYDRTLDILENAVKRELLLQTAAAMEDTADKAPEKDLPQGVLAPGIA